MREVTVVVSDPWEFVDERGSNVFTATVRARSEDSVSLEIAGHLYVASPRSIPTVATRLVSCSMRPG